MTYNKDKFADEINSITSSLSAVLQSKNADYGNNVDKSIDKWGLSSLAQRLDDKLSRFENLIREGSTRKVSDETIEDTLLDLAGYAILGYRKIREINSENPILKQDTPLVKIARYPDLSGVSGVTTKLDPTRTFTFKQ